MARKEESKEKEEDIRWKYLLNELLELIMSRLFLGDFISFRLVCKPWSPISPAPLSIPPHFDSQKYQWFICIPNNNKGGCNFFDPIYKNSYFVTIPYIAGAIIRHSKYGWLLMSKGEFSFFFFNPITRQTIKLTDIMQSYKSKGITFSSPPTSKDCIAFIYYNDWWSISILTCSPGDDEWNCKYLFSNEEKFIGSRCNPVFHDGALYCLSMDGRIGVFVQS
ncbi:hypothetical protein GIB67_041453 [Kingdonia uniflora]|uniref:KIB1-4 beta-propeller domain-containing protein n=1 Tax=Kingdonia uniflora TaxID=39325 RepID=A0A7J7LRU2_9MAGN|nr:hypothetical protein GIB67_041453 [Kingdonia uniflora]